MITMHIQFKNPTTGTIEERTFRTNNSGEYLFTGISENRQISCDSGFQIERRMKAAIRAHLVYEFGCEHGGPALGRIRYI